MADLAAVKLKDSSGALTNPASEESILLLRRIAKLLECLAVVDTNNVQRINISAGGIATMGQNISGSSAGTPAPNYAQASAPTTTTSTTYWQHVWTGPVDQRWQIIDAATVAYNQGIRSKLSFS